MKRTFTKVRFGGFIYEFEGTLDCIASNGSMRNERRIVKNWKGTGGVVLPPSYVQVSSSTYSTLKM
jgi:hypothetical protein